MLLCGTWRKSGLACWLGFVQCAAWGASGRRTAGRVSFHFPVPAPAPASRPPFVVYQLRPIPTAFAVGESSRINSTRTSCLARGERGTGEADRERRGLSGGEGSPGIGSTAASCSRGRVSSQIVFHVHHSFIMRDQITNSLPWLSHCG